MQAIKPISKRRPRLWWRGIALSALLAASASCVPAGTAAHPESLAHARAERAAPPILPESPPALLAPNQAVAANLALPVASGPNPAARPFRVQSASLSDQLRALDCLADAVYYEARSEGEDGQRAVAQVVLNRVRHSAYPASVCAVVYQGPQRAGGGCQFTFSCDGSLAQGRREPAWSHARRIAVEALAGRVYAPVGTATHYHSFAVFPRWAERLVKSAVIGAHIFYRWEGAAGRPTAFAKAYSGHEAGRPGLARAAVVPVPRQPVIAYAPIPDLAPSAPALDALPQAIPTAQGLPVSRVREEYRNSGAWRGTTG